MLVQIKVTIHLYMLSCRCENWPVNRTHTGLCLCSQPVSQTSKHCTINQTKPRIELKTADTSNKQDSIFHRHRRPINIGGGGHYVMHIAQRCTWPQCGRGGVLLPTFLPASHSPERHSCRGEILSRWNPSIILLL